MWLIVQFINVKKWYFLLQVNLGLIMFCQWSGLSTSVEMICMCLVDKWRDFQRDSQVEAIFEKQPDLNCQDKTKKKV